MKKILSLLFIIKILIVPFRINAQVDKHIDPSPNRHKHILSIGKHAATTFTIEKAKQSFAFGTKILQTCNSKINDNQDVACKVTIEPGSTLGSFGSASDGLDIINTQVELDAVMNNNSFFVKVVTDMPGNGGGLCNAGGPILACANTPGSSIVIVSGLDVNSILSDELWGEVLIHEFGHTRGLPHRDAPGRPIMATSTLGNNEVNDAEASSFHNGGVEDGINRKVDIVFLIDDTGSMGEEIEGVKNTLLSLLLNINSSTPGSSGCGPVYQLVTYKDAGNQRPPTTNLDVIRAQVATLSASGGGDCPEGSIEALNEVYESVVDKGVIYHATDASPHAGTEIIMNIMVSNMKSRGVKFSTLLSGDCISSSLSASSAALSLTSLATNGVIPFSSNNDDIGSTLSPLSLGILSAPLSAVDVFSFMANETGGVYAFLPEVNSGIPEYINLYENIGLNIALGAIQPTITHVSPIKGPAGGIIALTVNATRTNFNSSTTLKFNDQSIEVKGVNLISPTQLIAIIEISESTVLGLKSITANTIIEGSETEKAEGIGLFNVINAPSIPTVLSISPSTGKQGDEMTVKVTGINTNWNNTSVLSIGSGITILKTTALNSKELEAEIKISSNATIGYRNVSVTTESEITTENEVGPFLVINSGCDLSELDAGHNQIVYVGYPELSATKLSVFGINEEELTDYSFLWSTGETTPSITVAPLSTTVYSLEVTKGSCIFKDEVKVCAFDVKCGNKDKRVQICHKADKKTLSLCVSVEEAKIHLAHGDQLGACGTTYTCEDELLTLTKQRSELAAVNATTGNTTGNNAQMESKNVKRLGEFIVRAYPNPSGHQFIVIINSGLNESVQIQLYDVVGRKIQTINARANETIRFGEKLKTGIYIAQVIQGNKKESIKLIKQ